ncbi:MAG TPA: hypothetical protein VNZ02_17410, partial [Steroidobacteraceae bacterium]|nr:hypothetical protein [Steroidobacteraceae bacterium]
MRTMLAALGVALALCARGDPAFPPGIDVAGMDRSVAPGASFFAYANGTWLRSNEIPADLSSYGSWDVIEQLV